MFRIPFSPTVITLMAGVSLAQMPPAQMLTLADAEAIAQRNHPRISAARNRAVAAAQVPIEVRSESLPLVSANITGASAIDRSRIAAGGLNNPIVYDRLASGVTLSQMITDFGRNRELTGSARFHADAQAQLTEATRADIILEVDRAFYRLLRAQALLKVAEQTVIARQLVDDQVAALAKSNLKSSLDVSFANVNVAEAKLLLENQKNEASAAQANLAAALGASSGEVYEVVDNAPLTPPPGEPAQVIREAIQTRPELATLRLEDSAAERLVKAEDRLWYPTISAVSSLGLLPAHVDELPSRWAAVGVNVNLPIFNGHLFGARQVEAAAQARVAKDRLKDAEIQVVREVRVAYLNSLNAYQRLGLTDQLLEQARLALSLAQSRYDLGVSSIVELNQAQLSLTNAELAGASARYEYLIRRAELSYQLGANR